MLQDYGKKLLWTLLKDELERGGTIEVSDGRNTAKAPIDTVELVGEALRVKARFGSSQANFDWKIRRIYDAAGGLVDERAADGGRKVSGAVWNTSIMMSWS